MNEQKPINVYGINLTDEEIEEWSKREETTYLEYEIPKALENKLSKMIEKEIKYYRENKSLIKMEIEVVKITFEMSGKEYYFFTTEGGLKEILKGEYFNMDMADAKMPKAITIAQEVSKNLGL